MRFCPACGSHVEAKNSFCPACGNELKELAPHVAPPGEGPSPYAGFGVRLIADLIDTILMLAVFVLLLPILPFVNVIISIVVCVIYGASMESSSRQASLGKMALGLKVTDLEGKRISFARALIRWSAKEVLQISVVGWLTFIAIAFSKRKQGVHDLLAGTVVRST